MPILEIKDVTKVYEGKVTHRALNQLSFEVEQGEFLAVMAGPFRKRQDDVIKYYFYD
ncbi:hypothetical protein LSPH24S_00858 [Lysinibacillus sphaericus]